MSSSSSIVKTGTTCAAAAAAAASAASLPFAAHACHFLPPPSFRDPSISSVAKTLLSQSLPQQHPPLRLPLTPTPQISNRAGGHSSTSLHSPVASNWQEQAAFCVFGLNPITMVPWEL